MRRFFIPPEWVEIDRVMLPPEFVDRLTMLGLGVGDPFIVLDDSGWEYEVILTATEGDAGRAQVVRRGLAPGERRTKIGLYQGLLPPGEFAEILRLGTQIGIVEFVPIITARCQVAEGEAFGEANMARWGEMITTVAAETGRGRLPRLRSAELFEAALDRVTRWGTSLMIWEGEGGQDLEVVLEERPFSIHLFAPPVDGFAPEEAERALQRGVTLVHPPFDPLGQTAVGISTCRLIFEHLG